MAPVAHSDITPQMISEDTAVLLRVAGVHMAVKEVLVEEGVISVTLEQLAAAARDRIEGVAEWVVQLQSWVLTGLPAVVERICEPPDDDPHVLSLREILQAHPIDDAPLLLDCCYIAMNKLSSTGDSVPCPDFQLLCQQAAAANIQQTEVYHLLRCFLQLLAARQPPEEIAAGYMKALLSLPAAQAALTVAPEELLQLAVQQNVHQHLQGVEMLINELLDIGVPIPTTSYLNMLSAAVSSAGRCCPRARRLGTRHVCIGQDIARAREQISLLRRLYALPAVASLSPAQVKLLLQESVHRKLPCRRVLELPAAASVILSAQLVASALVTSVRTATADLVESVALLDRPLAHRLPKDALVDVMLAFLCNVNSSGGGDHDHEQLPGAAASDAAVLQKFASLVESVAVTLTDEDGALATRILRTTARRVGHSLDSRAIFQRVWEALQHVPTVDVTSVVKSAVAYPNVLCFLVKVPAVSELTTNQILSVLSAAVYVGCEDSVTFISNLPAASSVGCDAVATIVSSALRALVVGRRRDLIVCSLCRLLRNNTECVVPELLKYTTGGIEVAVETLELLF